MTTVAEWSDAFDELVNSYRRFKDFDKQEMLDSIEFDEYEKSLFLTLAQTEVVIGLYTGKNTYGEPFEDTEEIRRYLEGLVQTKTYAANEKIEGSDKLTTTSVLYMLPGDLAFITLEKVKFADTTLGCYNGSEANVYPVLQDEYMRLRKNPFRGATRYRVLRLDCGGGRVEIISKYLIDTYTIRYLKKPSPIILEELGDELSIGGQHEAQTCSLNEMLHRPILNRAVQMALATKGIQVN